MKSEDIKLLYRYNEWADERILDKATELTHEQITAPNVFGWGSLFGALAHILHAEYYWRSRLSGEAGGDEPREGDFADLEALRARWQTEHAALRQYIGGLTDEQVCGDISSGSGQRPLWHFLLHLYTHGVQHRSECAAMLTEFGQSPGLMDFSVFLSDTGK
ncbi:MAG: DinB family protein [Chloroflexi bacterium]|nr:DinB family protein [Chloroflexota bacterium]